MPFEHIPQPEVIPLSEMFRLKKYDGQYEKAGPGYEDPYVYQNSEGIFDDAKKPDTDYVKGMFGWLDAHGELYFIEALTDTGWIAVGDVTVKGENPPIAIWFSEYRGKGLGTLAMKAVIRRLKELGYEKITGSTVYKWNDRSLKMHERLGFRIVSEDEEEYKLELDLK